MQWELLPRAGLRCEPGITITTRDQAGGYGDGIAWIGLWRPEATV